MTFVAFDKLIRKLWIDSTVFHAIPHNCFPYINHVRTYVKIPKIDDTSQLFSHKQFITRIDVYMNRPLGKSYRRRKFFDSRSNFIHYIDKFWISKSSYRFAHLLYYFSVKMIKFSSTVTFLRKVLPQRMKFAQKFTEFPRHCESNFFWMFARK